MAKEGGRSNRALTEADFAEETGVANRREWLFPLLLAVGLTIFKLAFIIPSALGPYFSDEIMYREFAEELLHYGHYVRVQYPLLYPLAMVPGAASQNQWSVMLALGSFYSSLLVLPAYGLARLVMSRKAAVLATLLIAALPFHASYPRMVLSENIFYPLLVLAVWLVVRPRRNLLASDIVFGVVIAGLWLTRHVAMVLLPALFIAWWLRERFPHPADGAYDRPALKGSLVRFGALVLVFAVTYAPWLIMTMGGGASLAVAIGFGVSGGPSGDLPERDTARLIAIAGWYVAAYALVAAPVLSGFALGFRAAWREGMRSPFGRLVASLILIAGALLVAMTRHSFNVGYNYPEPTKLMSRYAIALGALFVIVAFAALERHLRAGRDDSNRSRLADAVYIAGVGVGLPLSLVAWGWYALVRGGGMIGVVAQTSPDIYRLHGVGAWFVVGCAVFYSAMAVLIWRRDTSWRLFGVFFAGTLALSMWGMPAYWAYLQDWQNVLAHGREAALFQESDSPVTLVVSPEVAATTVRFAERRAVDNFETSARFEYRFPFEVIIGEFDGERPERWLVELRRGQDVGAERVIHTYTWNDEPYAIVELHPAPAGP